MNVLTNKKSRADYKLVGVPLPPQVHNYFSLYTVAKGITKAQILRGLIDDWSAREKINYDSSILISEIADRLEKELIRRKEQGYKVYPLDFKKEVEKELLKKGLSLLDIKLILGKLNGTKSKEYGSTKFSDEETIRETRRRKT